MKVEEYFKTHCNIEGYEYVNRIKTIDVRIFPKWAEQYRPLKGLVSRRLHYMAFGFECHWNDGMKEEGYYPIN